MSIFNIFKQPPPPPPPPIYKRQPIATAALIFTVIATLVLGPVGYLWNGMAEDLKKKVDNKTLQLMITKDREALARQAEELKEREEKDKKQDEAILENQKTLIELRVQKLRIKENNVEVEAKNAKNKRISTERPVTISGSMNKGKIKRSEQKQVLTPEQFEKYLSMTPEVQAKYKKYLESKGYDTEGL